MIAALTNYWWKPSENKDKVDPFLDPAALLGFTKELTTKNLRLEREVEEKDHEIRRVAYFFRLRVNALKSGLNRQKDTITRLASENGRLSLQVIDLEKANQKLAEQVLSQSVTIQLSKEELQQAEARLQSILLVNESLKGELGIQKENEQALVRALAAEAKKNDFKKLKGQIVLLLAVGSVAATVLSDPFGEVAASIGSAAVVIPLGYLCIHCYEGPSKEEELYALRRKR